MSQPTATQLELQAIDLSTALGPAGLHLLIGKTPVTVTPKGHGHVIVTDDRSADHDYQGERWPGIKESMRDYFGMVSEGN